VLYLHGQPGSRREQLLIPAEVLERFGVRLISVDRPGYGNTDPLPGDRLARSSDVLTVCDALQIDSFPLVAVSAGGSYALALAGSAPDRVERDRAIHAVWVSGFESGAGTANRRSGDTAHRPPSTDHRPPDRGDG